MYATKLAHTGQYRVKRVVEPELTGPVTREPTDLNQLRKLLAPDSRTPLPIRIQGAGSACTDCNTTER